jgi:hypothetical protein
MTINQAAAKVRAILKKHGVNPKGNVSVKNNDYISELHVDLRYLYGEQLDAIEAEIESIEDDGNFCWEIETSAMAGFDEEWM